MPNSTSPLTRRTFLAANAALLLALPNSDATAAPDEAPTLPCGSLSVRVAPGGPLTLTLPTPSSPTLITFQTTAPLNLQLLDNAGQTQWLTGAYATVTRKKQSLDCHGVITTPHGTSFHFHDTYTPVPHSDSVCLQRTVTIETPNPADTAFLTRFSLSAQSPAPLRDHEFFVPGIWYQDNRNVPANALAADLTDDFFIIREDRMPLPLVMMRHRVSGATITLSHKQPDGSTCLADYVGARVIDSRIQVASLGVFGQDNPAVAFYYPATEGERTYMRGKPGEPRVDRGAKHWAERFHPVQTDVVHTYQIQIVLSQSPDFAHALRDAWRSGFDSVTRRTVKADLPAVYDASISLIADWCKTTNGATGVPFRLRLPKGELMAESDINYQMGFVGQQLPLGYHLIRAGLRNDNADLRKKGEAVVDFWAANSLTADGLPRTWYDTYPEPHWRQYNTFLRVATDGMIGALRAWDILAKSGDSRPQWLKFCADFGDWLIQHQNPDGSWYREYDFTSQPVNQGKQNTTHPIPYLVALARATGQAKYLDAARHASDWCWPNVHQAFSYVGGTADNPNVIDKEAGFLAIAAFLALHDATGDRRWLDAATQAGDFTESWTYAWSVPIPPDDPAATYPRGATTVGFSLIATGHSGADLFMAGAPFLYYRLYLGTGDPHYAEIARLLLHDTKQSVDLAGSLGYGHPGLCTEALSLAPPRGHGVNTWLPWLTASMIEPIARLQDAYGAIDTPIAHSAKAMAELRAQDAIFSATQGLVGVQPNNLQNSKNTIR